MSSADFNSLKRRVHQLEDELEREREAKRILADIVERDSRCSQCGKRFMEHPCGLTHTLIQGILQVGKS